MNFNLMHPAEQIVLLINRVYQKGLTTTSGGNLSIMDSEGNICYVIGVTKKIRSKIGKTFGDEIDVFIVERD